jgi:hypothetical protein
MTSTLASFLRPEGFARPSASAVLREGSVVTEAGRYALRALDESRLPMPVGVAFTAIYSKRDGIVDWRACVDPLAEPVEVNASHVGMALDPRVVDQISRALWRRTNVLAFEVDRGESA